MVSQFRERNVGTHGTLEVHATYYHVTTRVLYIILRDRVHIVYPNIEDNTIPFHTIDIALLFYVIPREIEGRAGGEGHPSNLQARPLDDDRRPIYLWTQYST